MLTLKNFLRCELEKQRVVLFYWLPVALASGIGCYLSLRHEPAPNLFVAMALLGGVFYLGYHFQTCSLAPFFLLLAVFCLGFFAVAGKAYYVAAPTLTYRFYGEIEGRIIGVDRARSGAVRVTLDQVELENISKSNTPQKVRLSINGGPAAQLLTPQGRLKTKGFLMPPPAPSEPGGFDFLRYAWFRGLGAVGYTREGVHITSGPSSGIFMRLFDRRMALSARIKAGVSEAASGPAAAIITGDRSSLTRAQLRDLRRSNLAHLLAISGLHVALLTGVVFGFFRRLCLLNANAFLHLNAKKIAAGFAILIGFYYVMISGAAVSTQRAFIMVSIVMLGVFFDRRALSLHSVALAALVILAWRPEDVSSAGFQMSFAATIALVTVFQRIPALPRFSRLRRMPVISLILSSLVAGLATAPFSAAHFNQVSHYGLLANILSLPVMSFLVAPSAVLAMMLMPFGAEAVGLWGVDLGLRWILAVAHFFAQPASAVTFVIKPAAWILPVFSASFVWIILWRGWGKGLGIVGVVVAFMGWHGSVRPDILIAKDGVLVGLLLPEGRALSKPNGGTFSAGIWAQNDGLPMPREKAYALWQDRKIDLYHHWSKNKKGLEIACVPGELHIVAQKRPISGECWHLSHHIIKRNGATAIWLDHQGKPAKIRHINSEFTRLWSKQR